MHTFFVTPGEFKGVGLEVTLKSLDLMKSLPFRYIIWTEKNYFEKFNSHNLQSYSALNEIPQQPGVYILFSQKEPVDWFKDSVDLCRENPDQFGVVTGPLEKKSFKDPQVLGHTEYLRQVFSHHDLFMTFFGDLYNCLLLTDHIPLSQVSSSITQDLITKGLQETLLVYNKLSLKKKVLLLGLNPHAGENHLLGQEEDFHKKALQDFHMFEGPLSPDGLFGRESYNAYSFVVANYHDQGLIAFKALNSFDAAQATLGLPFVRTSVDHGTAANIFGQNKAQPESMKKALLLAGELL